MDIKKHISIISKLIGITMAITLITVAVIASGSVNPSWFDFSKPDPSLWKPRNAETDLAGHRQASLIKMGFDIITKSPELIGPLASQVEKQYADNMLTCQSCHLEAGTRAGSGSFVGVANRFPQFRDRENKIGTLAERIDGCMERSMNGKKIPHETLEMKAMLAYMEWLSEEVPEEKEVYYKGYSKIELPEVARRSFKG